MRARNRWLCGLMALMLITALPAQAQEGLSRRDMVGLSALAPEDFITQWTTRYEAVAKNPEVQREAMWLRAAGIVDYPYFHWRETGETVPEDWTPRQAVLKGMRLDDASLLEAPAFKQFLDAWLHDRGGVAVKTLTGDNRWLRARFALIEAQPAAPEIRLYLLKTVLAAHIDENGARGIGPEIEVAQKAGAAEADLAVWRKAMAEDEGDRAASTAHVYKTTEGLPLYVHVFRPEGAVGPTPAVLWFHGGSFESGHWSYCPTVCQHMRSLGFTIIQVEQRTGQRFDTIPLDMLADAREAVGWARREAGALQIDPARLWVSGFSSGATLTAQLAVLDPQTIAGAIALSGCFDLTKNSWYMRSVSPKADVKSVSPVQAVGAKAAPMLIFQGRKDEMCPYEDAERMRDIYVAKGWPVRLFSFDGSHFFVFQGPAPREKLKAELSEGLAALKP